MSQLEPEDCFTIERHGDLVVVIPSASLEVMDLATSDEAARLIVDPVRQVEMPLLIFDLGHVDYFGSSFLSLLLRCWKVVLVKGGQMVLAGVSERARELLRITSLDLVWPIYGDRREAEQALLSD